MSTYTHIGYFYGYDAVDLKNKTADEIVKYMTDGNGDFRTTSDSGDCESNELDDTSKTSDDQYLVAKCVGDYFDTVDTNELTDDDVADQFIDIYKKC